jgi:hypothetical protein
MINSDMIYLRDEVTKILVKMVQEQKNVPPEHALVFRLAFDHLTTAEALLLAATNVQP